MAVFRVAKVISALPGTLTPNTFYAVRTGVGFDLYLSDSTGSVAHKVNSGPKFTYGATAPSNPSPGDVWFDTSG